MFTLRISAAMAYCATIAGAASLSSAATIHVPREFEKIQAAIDSATAGDTILVAAGVYRERLRLKPGLTLRSAGSDARGELGLKRAEATIVQGDFQEAGGPGVVMAEGSTIDGFTVTGVGKYDDDLWKEHFATFGELQPHEHIGAPGVAGVSVDGVERCTVANNIVHHIGYTGIAVMGAKGKRVAPRVYRNICFRNMGGGIGSMSESAAVIEENVCFENYYAGIGHSNASPMVINNTCYGNVRAGIGISERSSPIVRGNECYQNRRAGIGIRGGEDTRPIVEQNSCYENEMAGIGSRERVRPLVRQNRCYRNKMAGIGSRDDARPVIEDNECYENEMAGIGVRLGSAPVIRDNRCYRNLMAGIGTREGARPVIEDNACFENKMAGIASQQGAAAVIRGNRCYRNQMAGIGSRLGARSIIVDNDCFENAMAGVGVREGASPIIRDNRSHNNAMAGISARRGARPLIADNESCNNNTAGIGIRDRITTALIVGNRCLENRLVAIGLPDGATALIHGNELLRTGGGAPPLVAIKGGSKAIMCENRIAGGGVAGVLVQGDASILGNRFQGAGGRQGSAVWVWKDSRVHVADNRFLDYRNAVNASGSKVTAADNVIRGFSGAAIIVRKPVSSPRIVANTAITDDPKDRAVDIEGKPSDAGNILKSGEEVDKTNPKTRPNSPWLSVDAEQHSLHPLINSGRRRTVDEGDWELVVVYGDKIQRRLFNKVSDPERRSDLSHRAEQIAFRLQGLLERKEGREFQAEMGKGRQATPSDSKR